MSWPDRRVADALAERVASLPPVMQRADQELARLRQALVQAWAEIAELRVLADHDSLTGLANRRRMMAELEDVVEDCRRHGGDASRSEEHTSELQSLMHLVCRLLLEKKNHHTQDTQINSNIRKQ